MDEEVVAHRSDGLDGFELAVGGIKNCSRFLFAMFTAMEKLQRFITDFRIFADSVATEDFNDVIERCKTVLDGFIEVKKDAIMHERTVADRFNPFFIMGVSHRETIFHSRIIGELLRPTGTHGHQDLFLHSFFKCFHLEDFVQHITDSNWLVTLEKYTQGLGFIDIYLEHKKARKVILIENKLFATDQQDQLYRYYSFAKGRGFSDEDIRLIYLTNDGKAPSNLSMDETSAETLKRLADAGVFLKRSHARHTRFWIEKCLDRAEAERLKITLEYYLETLPNEI